jgi:hypothetical protein
MEEKYGATIKTTPLGTDWPTEGCRHGAVCKRAESVGYRKGRQTIEARRVYRKRTQRGWLRPHRREAGQTQGGHTTVVSPWEKRERGGLYYTRSRKEGGRVIREYIGGGPLGELAAETDALNRLRREKKAMAWREERESLEALDRSVEELYEAAEILARAALLAAGYHQHKRGEWRKKRERREPENPGPGNDRTSGDCLGPR